MARQFFATGESATRMALFDTGPGTHFGRAKARLRKAYVAARSKVFRKRIGSGPRQSVATAGLIRLSGIGLSHWCFSHLVSTSEKNAS
jgi:hypothetical protein